MSLLKECDYSVIQSALMTKFWTDFMSSSEGYGISVADHEWQAFLLMKRLPSAISEEKGLFLQAG